MFRINWNKRPERLILAGDKNVKLAKGSKRGFLTAGLSLAPYNLGGRGNVCSHATLCIDPCLNTSGNGFFPEVQNGRIRRTRLYFDDRKWFLDQLHRDLEYWTRKALRELKRLCVRLNVFSDIVWERVAPSLFASFPDIQFYDYTKIPRRFDRKLPDNYHLTFSWSGTNHDACRRLIARGVNVAVPFYRELPEVFLGARVISGDDTDLRFLDPDGVIVGLIAKGRARTDTSGFVVRNRELCRYGPITHVARLVANLVA